MEKTLKLIVQGGTILTFTYVNGQLHISKNNFYEVAELDDNDIIELT